MTESPITTNTKSGGMRVEGRVTHPPKSTPTKHRYAVVKWYSEEWRETMKNNEEQWCFDEKRQGTTSTRTLTIVLRLYEGTTIRRLRVWWSLEELWGKGKLTCILWGKNLHYILNCNRDNDKWGFGMIKHVKSEYVLVCKDETWEND